MNFRGSHDQAQNQAEGCDPLNRPKDRQARVTQAIGACIVQISRGTRYQARKKLGLNLVSEQTDKGRVYRIKEGRASPPVADRAKQAA
jgi:hypothetical protein